MDIKQAKFLFSATPNTYLLNLKKLFISFILLIWDLEVATIVASNFLLKLKLVKLLLSAQIILTFYY